MNPKLVVVLILAAVAAVALYRLPSASDELALEPATISPIAGEPSRGEELPVELPPVTGADEQSARVRADAAPEAEPGDERAGWNVRLLTGAGEPVGGAEVDLVVVAERMGGVTQKLTMSGPTDGDGRVFVADVLAELSEEQRPGLDEEGTQLWLVPAGLYGTKRKRGAAGLAPIGEKVTSGEASPPVEVTLVQPDAGAIRLRVHSPAGTFPAGSQVLLTEGWESLLDGSWQGRELPEGEAEAYFHFPAVGLNRQFEVEVKGASGGSLARSSFEGPKTAGATAEAVLELGFSAPRLRGRVLGVLDAPLMATLPHKPTLSSTLSARWLRSMGEIEVDESGRFDVEAAWLAFGGPRNVTLRLEARGDPDRAFEAILRVRPEEPIIDLGEFTLDPLPVVIAGRVVDRQGHGVATELEVTFRREEAGEEDLHWDRFQQPVQSDEEGRFQLRGALPKGVVWLTLRSSEYLLPGGKGTILVFDSGSDDAELVVSGQGWLIADASALPQDHLSHFFVKAWQQDAGDEVAKETRQALCVKNGPRYGPFTTGSLRVELDVKGIGTMASWDIVLRDGETLDLGALTTDRPLYAHTVILDTDAESLFVAPVILGKTATRRIHANEDYTGLRHSFLTLEPLESVVIQPHARATEIEVTGLETRVPWE